MAGRILPAIVGPAEKNTERTSRTEAMARADQCAAGAGDEDLVRRAASDSAAGYGGYVVFEVAEADADVDAPFDSSLDDLRVHVVLL